MFYSYFYKISFRILKNHRFYKKTGASWFYYHSHSCTTFNLCISSACLRPNLMPFGGNQRLFYLEHKKRDIGKNFRYNKVTTPYRKEISLCPLLILSYLLSI